MCVIDHDIKSKFDIKNLHLRFQNFSSYLICSLTQTLHTFFLLSADLRKRKDSISLETTYVGTINELRL